MKSKTILIAFSILIFSLPATLLFAWGAWGHKHINRAAVFALPEPMIKFYYNHIDFITEASVVPDLRRGILNDRFESPRHFIDIEDFQGLPADSFPKTNKEAYKIFDSAILNKNGYLPWHIQNLTTQLTTAFKKRNKSEILFISAELGHYVGDAHMPLHTSSNYDGQKTNQRGVHSLWESRLPELFGNKTNFKVDSASYIPDIPVKTWQMISQSHALVNDLLKIEKQTRQNFGRERLYKKDSTGQPVLFYNKPVFSDEYSQTFYLALDGMIEKQLRLSVKDLADYWYTAWINGGKPDLLSLDNQNLTRQNAKNFKAELKAWTQGKILNLSGEGE